MGVLHAASVTVGFGIFALRVHIGAQHLDCSKLVFADAPIEDLDGTRVGIKTPLARIGDDRDREGKLVIADNEHGAGVAFRFQIVALRVGGSEPLACGGVGDVVP